MKKHDTQHINEIEQERLRKFIKNGKRETKTEIIETQRNEMEHGQLNENKIINGKNV